MFRLLLSLLVILVTLSACRYWSLYRFADQFCHFDQHIEVLSNQTQTQLAFAQPVLPQAVFSRYFKATPYQLRNKGTEILEHYRFILREQENTTEKSTTEKSTRRTENAPFQVTTRYSLGTDVPLLSGGALDPQLSLLFTSDFVRPILRAACTDDFDLSLSELDIRFQLSEVDAAIRPSREQFIEVFGAPIDHVIGNSNTDQELNYRFDFILRQLNGLDHYQEKPIEMALTFVKSGALKTLKVDYLNYTFELDFETQTGRLLVIRHSDEP